MDPRAALERMERALEREEWPELRRAAADLRGWLKRGGFEPEWKACPNAFAYYLGRYGRADMKGGKP